MSRYYSNRREGDISAVSNELEFHLQDVQVPELLQQVTQNDSDLELTGEVNQLNTVELMVSMAPNVAVLNQLVPQMILRLSDQVQQMGGNIYAGSSLLQDTSNHEPAWYRTTSLSNTLARGFLRSGSQQLVIGIAREGQGNQAGEQFGIELYNFLRQLTPVILAISASSPYIYEDNRLVDSRYQSYRPANYQQMSARLPLSMFDTPPLNSLEEYHDHLQTASDEVNSLLASGELDANLEELYRDRNGSSYAPFETLEPHQIYSWIRLRPDHANEDSVFSLEVRISDLPNRVETIQMINSFISGLSYYASEHGLRDLECAVAGLGINSENFQSTLLSVAQNGLDTPIRNNRQRSQLRHLLPELFKLSIAGLRNRGIDTTALECEYNILLGRGNESLNTRRFVETQQPNPRELEDFLITRLLISLGMTE